MLERIIKAYLIFRSNRYAEICNECFINLNEFSAKSIRWRKKLWAGTKL